MDLQIVLNMRHLGEWPKREQWTRKQLEEHQARALRRLRDYAYARSPFYQRFHKGFTCRPLEELPVLTEGMAAENFDDLLTDRIVHLEDVWTHVVSDQEGKKLLKRYWVTTTSGRTGLPRVFLFNRDEWMSTLFAVNRVWVWAGMSLKLPRHLLHKMPIASLASGSPRQMSAQIEKTNKWMSGWMPMRTFDAGQPTIQMVRQLNDWQPHLLAGYTSAIGILADEKLAGRLRIHPHMIIPDSEVLTEETRSRIEAAWGHAPFDAFWAIAGGGPIAAERHDHNGLHLFEDVVIFEVVDEKHRPVPAGVYGDKVLITVLSSRTQPLIRYELNDRVRIAADAGNSHLPFRRIDGILGRTEGDLT